MLSVKEVLQWTNATIFEIWINCVGLLVFTFLIMLKLELAVNISYWYVFIPLFVINILDGYFMFIVFVRSILDLNECKSPFLKYSLNWLRLVLTLVFEVKMCYKMNGDLEMGQVAVQSTFGVVFVPVWLILSLLSIQACRLL